MEPGGILPPGSVAFEDHKAPTEQSAWAGLVPDTQRRFVRAVPAENRRRIDNPARTAQLAPGHTGIDLTERNAAQGEIERKIA
ncbi:hypothetical protein [Devosia nitrariae]|uniref:Uncharacterized protein n=1 Tax=Devosia nitrariae TaxID=2071872 RepID=A0ABQ5WBS1_9HYPH|nr:hypothetical protein [Devosia nitrariae]GLQ57292.1 hypothetical protein GCM10010862_45510 [Devosia nitrariae]